MEALVNVFKSLIAWVQEFIATVKEFAAGWDKQYGFETAE